MSEHNHIDAITAFAKAVKANYRINGASVVFEWMDSDDVRVGTAQLVWDTPVLHWGHLQIAPEASGILTSLFGAPLTKLWQTGADRFTCSGRKDEAWQWLEAVGFQPVPAKDAWMSTEWLAKMHDYGFLTGEPDAYEVPDHLEIFVCHFDKPCRFDEYGAWKKGKRAEPQWHKDVTERRDAANNPASSQD